MKTTAAVIERIINEAKIKKSEEIIWRVFAPAKVWQQNMHQVQQQLLDTVRLVWEPNQDEEREATNLTEMLALEIYEAGLQAMKEAEEQLYNLIKLPTCTQYAENIRAAAKLFEITEDKARDKFGRLSNQDWKELLACKR